MRIIDGLNESIERSKLNEKRIMPSRLARGDKYKGDMGIHVVVDTKHMMNSPADGAITTVSFRVMDKDGALSRKVYRENISDIVDKVELVETTVIQLTGEETEEELDDIENLSKFGLRRIKRVTNKEESTDSGSIANKTNQHKTIVRSAAVINGQDTKDHEVGATKKKRVRRKKRVVKKSK